MGHLSNVAGAALLAALAASATSAPAPASRIVVLAPHLAELVCAVGACERLVGAVAYSDHPDSVREVPRVGDAFAVHAEQVVALRPDLVLAWDGGTPPETIARLRALRLRVEPVHVRGLDGVAEALRFVGRWTGQSARAERAATDYTRRLSALRAAHASAAPIRVLYQIETDPLFTISGASPIGEAIALCGGRNIFADLPTLAAPVNREAVLARDPEAVVYARQEDRAAIERYWKRMPPVAATRAGALYAIDGDRLDRASPRLLEGIEQLCAALDDARRRRRERN